MLRIVKASAGSGKTYNLARQYITLLLKSTDRYAYRHILAVTFTNKATDEMKRRIIKELHVLATDPSKSDYRKNKEDWFVPSILPSDEDVKRKASDILCDILHDYSAFAVSTIDKFFQQALKAFSREIGQFASYQVELDKDSLVAESVDRILDSLTEEDGSLLSWLTENVLEQIEQGGRYNMDANLLEMAGRLQSSQRQEMLEQVGMNPDAVCSKEQLMKIRARCREVVSSFRDEVHRRARAALDVLEQAGADPAESNRKFLNALYVYDELKPGDKVEAPSDSFLTKAADCEQWFAKSKAKIYLPKVYPALEEPLGAFCDLWGRDFAVYNTACILDGQLYGLGVAAELTRTLKEIMKEKNVLCIDDSNTILRDIIDGSDAPFVYEKLGVRYEHFLLDEFQDTSRVQWGNFSPLLRESESRGGENLIVGDVKQSIYRWRGSDWKLLDETVPSAFPGYAEKVLDTNYRSLASIVIFNNLFFTDTAEVLDIVAGHEERGKGPMARIYADVTQKISKADKPVGSVSLTFCSKENELQAVLDSVREALAAGAKFSEIAVLVRSNAIGEQVARFLIDNGVTVMTDDSLKVKSALTVRRLVSLMSCIDNPDDTVSGYLAEMLDIPLPDGGSSLMDMAEELFRSLKRSDEDGLWKGELLHIQSFMDHLQDYVASNGNSLRGFLKFWEGENPSISSPSSGDSVRVMTIHKSKGLDFPYVIVPFAESITLYKADNYWCRPELSGTVLEDVADGVYDVTLSKSSKNTLFAKDYEKENFLQQVDNINTLYVAMTRAGLGMHLIAAYPSAKFVEELDKRMKSKEVPVQFSDFSQLLYRFALYAADSEMMGRTRLEDGERFDFGKIVDFNTLRKDVVSETKNFPVGSGDEFPSIPLNPSPDSDGDADVRERGRLKFSADSLDFFEEERSGKAVSNRARGVVLHDILASVRVPSDLRSAVDAAVAAGNLTPGEAEEAYGLLAEGIAGARERGWFPDAPETVLNETDIIDSDGQIFRPDRVVIDGGRVTVVDYKFGEHHKRYEKQLRRYADIWRRMGYDDVSAVLWYVMTDEVVAVQ